MKTLNERSADYFEKFSLGLLLATFVADVPPYARVIFVIGAPLAATAMVAVTQAGQEARS